MSDFALELRDAEGEECTKDRCKVQECSYNLTPSANIMRCIGDQMKAYSQANPDFFLHYFFLS